MIAPTTPVRPSRIGTADSYTDKWTASPRRSAGADSSRREITQRLFAELVNETNEHQRRVLRHRLVEANMPVAAAIARRYGARGANREDLEQVAYVGLIKAVRRFDGALDNDFLSYAVPTITGEVKRYFRDACWAVRPPRWVQEMQAKIPPARELLAQRLGRLPDLADIAALLGASEEEVAEALAATGCFTPASLDAPAGTEAGTPVGQLIEHRLKGLARCEDHVFVTQLLQHLSARDRQILRYRYVEGQTQQQIAQRIGVTQMQVSRLLSRILRDLGDRAAS